MISKLYVIISYIYTDCSATSKIGFNLTLEVPAIFDDEICYFLTYCNALVDIRLLPGAWVA